MTTTVTTSLNTSADQPSQSQESLRDLLAAALQHFRDPEWLGEHSPLASPFFLGEYALKQHDLDLARPADRGRALQRAIQEIAVHLDEGLAPGETSLRRFVELSYFSEEEPTQETIYPQLGESRANYFRHRPQYKLSSLQNLELHLVQLVNPSLRLEHPALTITTGYAHKYAEALDALAQGRTVGIGGMGGVGKTTLGIRISYALAAHDAFWYTFCLGLNDSLDSLLYALAAFLKQRGSTALWSLMAARRNSPVDAQVALGTLRYDIEQCSGQRLLFCIDELDLLRSSEYAEHARLVAFLEGMRGVAPMLWIGQQILIDVDHYLRLDGLQHSEIHGLVSKAGVDWSDELIVSVAEYSRGNPRVLEMLVALHKTGDHIDEVVQANAGLPSMEFLLNRIWVRLDQGEQELLCSLSVYRTPAPIEVFPKLVFRLAERRLVDMNVLDGVALSPLFRDVVYSQLAPATRRTLHLLAAHVRAQRGAYTDALHHFVTGGEPEAGIGLWQRYQAQEINQGQADGARRVLGQVDDQMLTATGKQQLSLLVVGLDKLRGEYERGLATLRSTLWQNPVLGALADRLQGDIADLMSDYTRANNAYLQGLKTVDRLLGERSLFHKNLAWTTMRQGDLNAAWHHAQLAWYEAENMRGYISDELRRFDAAEVHYRNALALAKELDHTQGIAKTSDNLGGLLARRGQFEEAQHLWRASEELFTRVGYIAGRAGALVNQAYGYNLSDEYEKALPKAAAALKLFEQISEPYGMAVAHQNLGESCLGQEQWVQAGAHAERVLAFEDESINPDALRVAGLAQLGLGKIRKAEDLLLRAESSAREIGDPYLDAYIQRDIGRYYMVAGHLAEACSRFTRAQQLFDELGLPYEAERTQMLAASVRGATA